eukprot:752984-Pyramimonas_sp.AAC.1
MGYQPDSSRLSRPEKLVGSTGSHYSSNASGREKEEPFLKPKELPLLTVPFAFTSKHQWCDLIAHNLRAEYFHVFTQAVEESKKRGRPVKFKASKQNELQLDAGCVPEGEALVHHLLKIGKNVHLTTSQEDHGGGAVALRIKPPLQGGSSSGTFVDLGYVGSYIS